MGARLEESIDAWLRGGGLVVTASERAARSLTQAFNRARRAEGLTAWQAPNIQDWQSFVRTAWDERNLDGRIVLNSLQEQSLWAGIVSAAAPEAARVVGTRDRLAALAMQAHGLICAYAPQLLNSKSRIAWDQDAGAFSQWLSEFDALCALGSLISPARLPLELIETLKQDSAERAPAAACRLRSHFAHAARTLRRLGRLHAGFARTSPPRESNSIKPRIQSPSSPPARFGASSSSPLNPQRAAARRYAGCAQTPRRN